MALTDAQYTAWLTDICNIDRRVTLAVIQGQQTGQTLLLSTLPYSDGTATFDDWIIDQPSIDEGLGIASYGSLKFADLVGDNLAGKYPIGWGWAIYYGDVSWPMSDFRWVACGNVSTVEQAGNIWTLGLVPKASALDKPVLTDNQQVLTLGYVTGIEPVLYDPANLQYRINTGAVSFASVYDRGVLLSAGVTANNAAGTFRLTNQPAGVITCDVATANMQLQQCINALATMAGITQVVEYIGLATAQRTYTAGIVIYADGMTYRQAIEFLAGSVGAYVAESAQGALRIIALQNTVIAAALTMDDIIDGSVKQSGILPALDYITVNWARNWRPLQPAEIAGSAYGQYASLSREYSVLQSAITASNGVLYNAETVDTALQSSLHATELLNNIKTRRQSDRRIYSVQVHDTATMLKAGDTVTIEHDQIPFSTAYIQRVKRWSNGLLSEIELLESA